MEDGLLDTNVFIHAYANDRHTAECRRFLLALERGDVKAYMDPLVLHELSYALPRFVKQMTRAQVGEYLLMVLGWDSVGGEKEIMVDAVHRWQQSPSLAFVDAYLAAIAARRKCAVYTKNLAELRGQGVHVPEPLPLSS
jgi:predicted nucleic acid-binding protein